jgi:Mor family transcriptional regulator
LGDREVIEALPGDLRRIAEVAGVEAAVKIASAFRGTYLYVPGLDDFIRQLRDEKIRRHYDRGIPVRALAVRFGVSQRSVRKILNRAPAPISPMLYRLFEEL